MSTRLATPRRPETADAPKFWTTAEFDRLIGQGIIEEGSNTYLWEGQIVEPMSEYQPHRNAHGNLLDLLKARFPSAVWLVDFNAPLPLEDGTKPQPDVLVVKGTRSRYQVRPPNPADVALLVEISDSTYPRDSGERLRKFAEVGIALYWIVNIPARRIEVYESPRVLDDGASTYGTRTDYGLDRTIPFRVTLEGITVTDEIAVIDVLRDSLEQAEAEGQ